VKLFSSKRRVVTAAVLVLLVLFLLRPGASQLKARITNSISRAVARPAEIGSVRLRFLPQPGFDLENLVIYEDPAFGAEPMLRAPQVTAVVRLTSLLRGRLDIARLELTEPSLNLVHRQDGRWNWEALLERAARMPLAPTAKSKSESRPGFPYIEASSGRINFKAGQEKEPYALLNADFALWQDSENTWGVRLKAEPLRTDMSLSDTGLLRISGSWQRAGSLRETPLQFSLEWNHAQLGQLTKLVLGTDKGWRGDLRLEATLSGIPAAMRVTADTSIQDFHRYDISSAEGMGLAAHCEGRYSSAEGIMHEIFCNAPVGNGMITLHGDAGLPGVHRVDLALDIENVPANAVAQLARCAKKDLPADLVSAGGVQGNFVANEEGASPAGTEFSGHGEISDLRLQSANAQAEFAPGNIPFSLSSGHVDARDRSKGRSVARLVAEALPSPGELYVEFGPFAVALGRPAPAQARGWVGRSGYGLAIRGDGEVAHILRLAGLIGLPAMKANVEGSAQMELQIAGSWAGNTTARNSGFYLPQVTGTVQLRNVRAEVRGVNAPVEISSAELQLLPEEARVEKLNALVANAHWTGSVDLPRGCGTPGTCLVHFNLNTEETTLSDLYKGLSSQPSRRRWYQVLTPSGPAAPTFLESLRASGKVSAGRVRIRSIVADRVSASVELERGKLKISELRADLLGGEHHGAWQADFTAAPAVYTGSGTVVGISLQQIAEAMRDPWISGTADGTYQVSASGADADAFWDSAEGELQFGVRDGALPRISLPNDEKPLRVGRWQGRASLRGGEIEIAKSQLISAAEAYEVSGTASLGQVLDLKLVKVADMKPTGAGAMVYSITGTLREPRVELTPAAETQARLKP